MTPPLRAVAVAVLLLVTLAPRAARSTEFEDVDFSLRLPAALSQFSPYADVAAKAGASAASRFGSSENPAVPAWSFTNKYSTAVSAQYSNVLFDNDTQLHFISESMTFGNADWGVIRVDAGTVTSNERPVLNSPADFDFELAAVRLNYSKRLADSDVSLGGSVSYGQSDTKFKLPGFNLAHAEKDIWTFRLGGLWQPADKWLVGLLTTYVHGPTDTRYAIPTPLGLGRYTESDVTHQFTVHPGIAYEYAPNALAHLDYQYAHFTNDGGSLDLHRFKAGTDIKLAQFLYLRAGGTVDVDGNTSWSVGAGFYPSRHVFIDVAYQNDMFHPLEPELGTSRTLNVSLSILW